MTGRGAAAEEPEAVETAEGEGGGGTAGPMLGSFATTGAIQVIQAVIGVLLARILGPGGRGELAAIILWPTLLTTIGSLGLAQSATYHAARAKRIGTLVGSTLAVIVVDSLILIGIGLAVIPVVLGSHGDEVVRNGQLYLLLFVPLNLVAVTMMSILNGRHRFVWFQSLRLLMFVTTIGGLAALAIADEMTLRSAALAYAAGIGVAALLGLGAVLATMHDRLGADRQTVRALLGFGVKSQLSQSMWTLNERADQLVISVFFSAASLGLYVVAVTMTSLTTLIGFSVALVALPVLARMRDGEERRRTARAIAGATLIGSFVVTLPVFVAEPWLIRLLFGEDFSGATDVGRILLVAAMVFGLNRVLEAMLQAVGRPLESSIGEGIALAVTAAGLAALLPLFGIIGAGVTSLVAYSTSAIFLARRAARGLEISTRELLVPDREMVGRIVRLVRERGAGAFGG